LWSDGNKWVKVPQTIGETDGHFVQHSDQMPVNEWQPAEIHHAGLGNDHVVGMSDEQAAVKIQSRQRGRKARREAAKAKREREKKEEEAAA
jgi:hypothetical protein